MAIPGRAVLLLASLFVVLSLAPPLAADEKDLSEPARTEEEAGDVLPARYTKWLEDVALLITPVEREAFLALRQSYQRDHFIRRFWKIRDPFPRTAVNEMREAWEARVALARDQYEVLEGEAVQMLLYLGPPKDRQRFQCSSVMTPIDVWFYPEGSDRIGDSFTVIFTGRDKTGSYRLWEPSEGLRSLLTFGRSAASAGGPGPVGLESDQTVAKRILQECVRGDDIVGALVAALDFSSVRDALLPPPPDDEWVLAFLARSTDMPEDAEPLAAELRLSFPGRHQSRTVVQGLVAVERGAAAATEGKRFYNLVLDGEVLRKGKLFESFRYRFDFPATNAPETLPLVAQRYLRPGDYQLILKVEDVGSKRVYREERELRVPVFDPAVHAPPPPPVVAAPTAGAPTDRVAPVVYETRLLEANASISTGDHSIKIMALPDLLVVGKLRVTARTRGEGIARVAFELNGEEKLRKSRPPYSVELDLGKEPRLHTLRAIALDAGGKRLAVDEVVVNGGPHRFAVRLLEPQPGQIYTTSVRAHAEVEVPEGERLDRVELFLNETQVATLYQPPFEQPIFLDGKAEIAYVRVVAYLASGAMDEEVVFINAPDFVDNYRVDFVELYTTMVDRKGDFIEDVTEDEVVVLEDGVEQQIRRFEKVRDQPISAGLVIDTSTSMMRVLRDVRKAAHRFLETVLTERDRAAVITFNDAPQLQVRFTSDVEILAGGLVGLVAEGETALYDTLIYALHYFSGVRGKRAVIVLTDGEDSSSTYGFDEAIEFARQTGVAIYIIGLGLPSEPQVRSLMRQLASETGGESFFIERVDHLTKVYDSIQLELRSQYLIGYQSPQTTKARDEFREVEVQVDRKGVKAKTIRGYYP